MPARLVAIFTAAAVFFGFRSKKNVEDPEVRLIKAINTSHESWIEKGWVEEKVSTKA